MVAAQQGYQPAALLNMMNENGKISRSHGIPESLLQQQAAAMQLPILNIAASWQTYEAQFIAALQQLKAQHNIKACVFGDIDLEPHREWEEKVCAAAGIEAILPLWQQSRRELVLQMLTAGIETMIVSCNTTLGERFLGRVMNLQLLQELEAEGVDVCGENGEFHTLVVNCPLFRQPLTLPAYEKVRNEQYWFLDWKV